MADITSYNQGNVSDEGKVNWRGDQVTVTPGDQSIYDSSSVQLADLGSRKVVGDRVFRYARAQGSINPSEITQIDGTGGGATTSIVNATAGGTNPAGAKVFTFYFATSASADFFAEGTLYSQSGTAANMGQLYRVKSHASVADTSTVNLVLYDSLKLQANVTDSWSLMANKYKYLTRNTAGTATPIGVCPIAVTTGDYFWLQTWGPCNMKAGVGVTAGISIAAGNTGQNAGLTVVTGTVPYPIGYAMQTLTVSQRGLVFLTIAP